jgi:hypothetical protein
MKKSHVLTADPETLADAEMFSTFRAAGAFEVMSEGWSVSMTNDVLRQLLPE